jgi:RND family efflux transporter MFP subunit
LKSLILITTVLAGSVLAGVFLALGAAQGGSERSLPIRGIGRPIQETTISTDLFARISNVNVREGGAFKAGQPLIEFDCNGYLAERKAAVAEHRAQQLDYENKLVLEKHSAIGRHEIGVAEAITHKAAAEIERLDARIAQCVIEAPFDGKVADLFVDPYEMPAAGNPLVRIIDDTRLEIDLIVPSDWLSWLEEGRDFTFTIDETGRQYEGRVIRKGAAVDPVSQTIELRARFVGASDGVLAGMSGFAKFVPPEG